jgi:hypothetical protein
MKALVAILMLSLCTMAVAEPSEHNYKVKEGDWQYTYRHREGTWHAEIGRNVGPINVMYRYADLGVTRENRIKFTHQLWQYGDFKVKHRIEYRTFDKKEDHWRYRFIFEYKPHIYGPLYGYVKVQPRWAFKDGRTVVDHRDQLGLTWKQGNWKITPFVERYALDGFEYRRTVYGTHFEIDL